MKKKHEKKDKEINFKYNLSLYWSLLKNFKPYLFIILLLAVIVEVSNLIPKLLIKRIIDDGGEFINGAMPKETYVQMLILFFFIYLGITITRVVGNWLNQHYMNLLSGGLIYDLKKKFFNHIIQLDHNFHTTHKTGSLISRLLRGAGSVERMTDVVAYNVLPLVLELIIVGIAVAYFSLASFIVIVIVGVTFIGYSLIIQERQKESNVELNRAEDMEKANISDIFTNIDSIKYYGKEKLISRRYQKLAENSRISMMKFWGYFRNMNAGQNFIVGVGLLLMLYFPFIEFLNGEISIGTIVFMYSIYGNLVGPMYNFVGGVRGYYRSMADFEDLFQYNRRQNVIEDKPNAPNLSVKEGEVEFKDIKFVYHGKKKYAINNLSLKIASNEKVALVGHSGCGKTTLVKLLYRLYDTDSGEILIDGKNINEFKQESLRSELSIVPQEAILFDDTIYNNIAFSNPSATRQEVFNAMKFAQLYKFVKELPQEENTIVGERGVKLSGGEKQRVSIARAILADKRILVLDEATSSLDSKTEYEIQNSLSRLLKGRTSIIIAHRLSTIMHADKIIVLDKGKVVQEGKHQDLIKRKGIYKELWNLQKGGYIKE